MAVSHASTTLTEYTMSKVNDSADYHTGRAAAYETCSRQLMRFLERCADEKRVPHPHELREIAVQWEGYSLSACEEANKRGGVVEPRA